MARESPLIVQKDMPHNRCIIKDVFGTVVGGVVSRRPGFPSRGRHTSRGACTPRTRVARKRTRVFSRVHETAFKSNACPRGEPDKPPSATTRALKSKYRKDDLTSGVCLPCRID